MAPRKKAETVKASAKARPLPEIEDDDTGDTGDTGGKFPDKPNNEKPSSDGDNSTSDLTGADEQTKALIGETEEIDAEEDDEHRADQRAAARHSDAIKRPPSVEPEGSEEPRTYIDRKVERAGMPEGGVTFNREREIAAAQSTGRSSSRTQRGEAEAEEQRAATTSNPPIEQRRGAYRQRGSIRIGEQVPLQELNREHRAQRRTERDAANIAANAASAAVKSALGENAYVDPATAPDGSINPRTGVRMRKPARGPVEATGPVGAPIA